MTIRILFMSMLAGLLAAGAAGAECVYPRTPDGTPDGATATQEQMMEGMKAVKQYNEAVTTYLSCLDEEMKTRIAAAGEDASPEQIEQIRAIHTKRHNAAVEALESHAQRFNEQVRAFKAREKS